MTGGYTQNSEIKTTSIIDIDNDQRTSGPDLIVGRYHHACNTIEIGSKKFAIVLGGYSGGNLASTELLDLDQLDQGSWIMGKYFTVFIYFSKSSFLFVGPNFPHVISHLTLLSTSSTSLFAIGGRREGSITNKVYKFTCTGTTVDTCQWVEHQTLQYGRINHVAIPLTDAWVTQLC